MVKKVSFSEETSLIPIDEYPNRLWYTGREITAFKHRHSRTIRHVQNIGFDLANIIDASDYMGLELHLSKRLEKECELHRQNYIRSVVEAQVHFSSEDLATFACHKSQSSVARSHYVAQFYADMRFDELSLAQSLTPSKHHGNASIREHQDGDQSVSERTHSDPKVSDQLFSKRQRRSHSCRTDIE